jgi:pimeloyl-ACP methyl ester carboxylesterase
VKQENPRVTAGIPGLQAREDVKTLAYERAGTGPGLVLLHGLGHRRQGWDAVRDRLTPHRDVISVDLPGHGQSPPLQTGGQQPVEAIAAQIGALLSELGLSRPHLAGNSLGGTIALALAAQGRAASVTALSPAGFPGHSYEFHYDRVLFTLTRVLARGIRPLVPALSASAAGRALLYGAMVTRPGRITPEQARGDVAGFAAAGEAMRAVFAGPMRFTVPVPEDVPVTIAWGTSDRVLPVSNVRVARRRLPHARFVPLPGCGHVPMTDDPGLVARILLAGSGTATLFPAVPGHGRGGAGSRRLNRVAACPRAARTARRGLRRAPRQRR